MIGKLKGIIDSTDQDTLIIDVNGVGYQVHCAGRVMQQYPAGAAAELIIETHVREDHIQLFGFTSALERDWFRLLATVQGVGNKTALAILNAYAPDQLSRAILSKDAVSFKAISGIGAKLAERIVTELKDKALKLPTSSATMPAHSGMHTTTVTPPSSHADDAISALVNLGYSRSDAYSAALKALEELGEKAGLDALIKTSLKEVARK